MAAFSDIAVRIGADFVGAPAFKKADTAVDKLYKTTTKLAAAFGVTFSAAAVGRFAASSIRAFAAEERQIASLTATVKSLGLAFQSDTVNQYIENLERLTGIARDELQPAFQKLLTQTGSVAKSQEILGAAIKVSFSGLMSTEEAANALTQAYVGNVKGLKQFNLGLTNTELAAMSFDQILSKVEATYKNQFKAAMENTETKLNKVKVAADNAKESIGEGLLKAMSDLAGNGDIDKANSKLEKFGQILGQLIGNAFNPVKVGDFYLPIPNLMAKAPQKNTIGNPALWRRQNAIINKKAAEEAAKLKKIEDTKLATLRKQTAEKKAQAAVDKANALLAKAGEKFDIEGIQLQAALANQSLTIEERKRLELKQAMWDLEQAIAQNDQKRIESATALLEKLLGQFNVLTNQLTVIEEMYKLFASLGVDRNLINLLNLEDALNLANQMAILGQLTLPANFPKPTSTMVTKEEADAALIAATSPEALAWAEHERIMANNRRSFLNPSGTTGAGVTPSPTTTPPINITVNGAIDAEGTARTIVDVLSRSYGRGALPAELLIL